jgi:hypothetical protein
MEKFVLFMQVSHGDEEAKTTVQPENKTEKLSFPETSQQLFERDEIVIIKESNCHPSFVDA